MDQVLNQVLVVSIVLIQPMTAMTATYESVLQMQKDGSLLKAGNPAKWDSIASGFPGEENGRVCFYRK